MNEPRSSVPIEVYIDYICPFCYVGNARLQRIAQRYPVTIQYRFVEIHPDNPPQGRPLSELGYPPEQWRRMMDNLNAMVSQEGLPMGERTFTTNSRKALLLAQATLDERPVAFPALNEALFQAYFTEGRNIGEEAVLRELAQHHGIEDLLTPAWETALYRQRLLEHVEAAQQIGLTGVPTVVVADQPFAGAVSMETLEEALRRQGL
ncbi:DsbA family oxidoreductase [Nitrococcus mobilis]|uniref:DSBA-like thioredoxin domain-containing protein n=1 Tax=Nitrococcus mobilis Nb-231 TaxID=314278 RepID=A4BUV8_9GAMM|nr:DsbA family protein [Nitrococcus mobilis]EAR20472.1 hypothetical protein NB231_06960 [Nitrococcus mobilis Nb-231]